MHLVTQIQFAAFLSIMTWLLLVIFLFLQSKPAPIVMQFKNSKL